MTIPTTLRRAIAAFAIVGASASAVPAQAVTLGEKTSRPDVVQVRIYDKPDGTAHKCTGTALNEQWILTASHCVEGETYQDPDVSPEVVKVHYSNDKANPGPETQVDRFVKAKYADFALLHVDKAHPLPHYPEVATEHEFREGERAFLYGYGKGHHDAETTWLHRAELAAIGTQSHISAGEVIEFKGITGGSNHGDSGGPIIDDAGRIIAVNVIGSHAIWANPYAPNKGVDIQHYADWIHQTIS